MLVGIHQPHYLPWLRYFEKIDRSDLFIVLDDVQFEKNGYQNRNRLKGAQGAVMLTAPVRRPLLRPIREIELDEASGWRAKHLRTVEHCCGRAPYFAGYWPSIRSLLNRPWERLADLNLALLRAVNALLGVRTPLVRSSELGVAEVGTARLAALCSAVGGTAYLSGAFALDAYLDAAAFRRAGIELVLQRWTAPVYRQLYPKAGFVPDLSILDLLFNEGPRSLQILRSAGGAEPAGPTPAGDDPA